MVDFYVGDEFLICNYESNVWGFMNDEHDMFGWIYVGY